METCGKRKVLEGCDPSNFPGAQASTAHLAAPEPSTWGRASNLCTDFQQLCVLFPADIKWAPGFPVLPPQSDLQASAPGGPSACYPLPCAITLSVRHRAPHTAASPPVSRGRGCGHVRMSFSVRWVESDAGPKDSVYLKQVAQGNRRYEAAGPGKSWAGLTRQQRLQAAPQAATCPTLEPPPVTGYKASSRAFCYFKPDSTHSALGPR